MSLKKSVLSVVTAATVAAGSLTSLASTASAGEWHGHGGNHGGNHHAYAQRYNPWQGGNHHAYRGYNNYDGDYGYRRHRNHEGRNLAIGAFATILGIAIASQAARAHNYDGDND